MSGSKELEVKKTYKLRPNISMNQSGDKDKHE